MNRLSRAALVAFLFLTACGGDKNPNNPGNGGGNSMTATIDGQAWSADPSAITVTGSASATNQGTITITGVKLSGGITVSLVLSFVGGKNNFPLGVNINTTPGGIAQVSVGANGWITDLTGSAGNVEITDRTATHIAGTFFFTAAASVPGTNPASRTVTSGAFDFTTTSGTLPPLPIGAGSKFTATINGVPWNAATVVTLRPGPGLIAVSAASSDYSFNLTPLAAVAQGSDYGIPSQASILVVKGADSWNGGSGADVGNVHFTLVSASRDRATFTGTLPKSGGGSAMVITDGVLNVALP